ncbi:MAG: hypothetical protein B5M56_00025 [Desulfococcus sp. 4484_241]|nr:MAG: hypothetical protein B5M56_00025 [Desulfococcus sp. 4484_241]
MDVSVVIVNWNTRDLLLQCISSIYDTVRNVEFEIWVVDNGSGDGSVAAVRDAFPEVTVIENRENLGFARANNRALERISGRYALLLNSDAVLTNGAVESLYRFMEETPAAGMACGQLLNGDGSLQNSFASFPGLLSLVANESVLRVFFPRRYKPKHLSGTEPAEIDSGIGACLMVRKEAMDEVGLMDERYFFFFEETDWALAMKLAGWKSFFVPSARIYHLQGQSVGHSLRSRILFYQSRYIYFKKWYGRIYSVVPFLVMARLAVNLFANGAATVLTLGMARPVRSKLLVYAGLVHWHLKNLGDIFRPGIS